MRLTTNENMTTTHTHTSGPWQVVTGEDWDGATVQTQSGRIVACCDGCDIPGATMEPTTEEAKANARLIAAAPEMLEALLGLRDYLQTLAGDIQIPPSLYLKGKRAMDYAEAALAKTRGGEA